MQKGFVATPIAPLAGASGVRRGGSWAMRSVFDRRGEGDGEPGAGHGGGGRTRRGIREEL